MFSLLKYFEICFVFSATLFVLYAGVYKGWNDDKSDFNNYYFSSKLLMQGEEVASFYDNEDFNLQAAHQGVPQAKFTPFPPLTALVMLPLANFQLLIAKRIWMIFSLLLLIPVFVLIKRLASISSLSAAVLLSVFFMPVANNIRFGQFYILLTLMLLVGLYLAQKERHVLSAFSLAVFTPLKYVPVFVALPLMLKSKRFAITFVVGVCALFGLQLLLFDFQSTIVWVEVLLKHSSGYISGQGANPYAFQSIESMLNNLLKISDKYVSDETVKLIVIKQAMKWMFSLFVLAPFAWLAWKYRVTSVVVRHDIWIIISFMVFFILIPASANYHLLLMLIPVSIFMRRMPDIKLQFIASVALIFMLTVTWTWFAVDSEWHVLNVLSRYPRLIAMFALGIYVFWTLRYNFPRFEKVQNDR